MLILSLDTSGDVCSVAVFDGAVELSTYHFRHDRQLSERLPGIVEFLLRDRGVGLSEIEAYAVGLGPGSFTGVRIGVTLAKTLAYAANRPLVGVSSLDALAEPLAPIVGISLAAVAPTRRTEVVAAFYAAGSHDPVAAPSVVRNVDVVSEGRRLLGLTSDAPLLVCGEAAPAVARDTVSRPGLIFRPQAVSAAAVARIAAGRLERGAVDDVFALTPLYVTPSPVG